MLAVVLLVRKKYTNIVIYFVFEHETIGDLIFPTQDNFLNVV